MGGQSSGSQTRLWYQKGRVYARLAVCMWASVSVRRAALCAASVSSWGGTVRKARVQHVGCRLANTFLDELHMTVDALYRLSYDPQSPRPGEPFSKGKAHLAQAVELLGPVPAERVRRSPRAARWFRGDGSALRNIAIAPPPPGVDAIARVLEENFAFARRDARDAADFLRALLRYEPDARVSARRALDLPWLADGGDLVL